MAGFSTQWATQLLQGLHDPVTPSNLEALAAWARAEGGSAAYNPFNTTQNAPGATPYNSNGGHPVWNYPNYQEGLNATLQTLQNGMYGPILSALAAGNNPQAVAQGLSNTHWGTNGALVSQILGGGQNILNSVPGTTSGGGGLNPGPQSPSPTQSLYDYLASQSNPQYAQGMLSLAQALGQTPLTQAAMQAQGQYAGQMFGLTQQQQQLQSQQLGLQQQALNTSLAQLASNKAFSQQGYGLTQQGQQLSAAELAQAKFYGAQQWNTSEMAARNTQAQLNWEKNYGTQQYGLTQQQELLKQQALWQAEQYNKEIWPLQQQQYQQQLAQNQFNYQQQMQTLPGQFASQGATNTVGYKNTLQNLNTQTGFNADAIQRQLALAQYGQQNTQNQFSQQQSGLALDTANDVLQRKNYLSNMGFQQRAQNVSQAAAREARANQMTGFSQQGTALNLANQQAGLQYKQQMSQYGFQGQALQNQQAGLGLSQQGLGISSAQSLAGYQNQMQNLALGYVGAPGAAMGSLGTTYGGLAGLSLGTMGQLGGLLGLGLP